MKLFIALVAVLAVSAPAYGKTWDRCSLAKEMYAMGVPKSELPIWTCLAEHESNYRAHIVGPKNKNGTRDYGIFQINNRYWCKPADGSKSSNGCKLSCDALLDNIKNSVTCARIVKKEQGWTAWSTWKFCSGKLPSIDSCF